MIQLSVMQSLANYAEKIVWLFQVVAETLQHPRQHFVQNHSTGTAIRMEGKQRKVTKKGVRPQSVRLKFGSVQRNFKKKSFPIYHLLHYICCLCVIII